MKRCPICQSEYTDEHRFCIDDGTELIEVDVTDTQPVDQLTVSEQRVAPEPLPPPKRYNRWTLVLVVAIFAVAALLIARIVTSPSEASENETRNRSPNTQQVDSDRAVSAHSSEDLIAPGSEVQITDQQSRELNVFFSNFVEARVEPFQLGEVTNEALVHFAVWHNFINRYRFFEQDPNHPGYIRIAASRIAESVEKYFGIADVSHRSVEGADYSRGHYSMGNGDGEIWPFAHLVELRSLGANEYTALVQNYWMPDYDVDKYGTTEDDWRRMGYDFERDERMRTRIRRVNENGGERYILLEHLLAD